MKDAAEIRRDPTRFVRSLGTHVGARARFLGINRDTFGSEPYLVSLGDHVTLTDGVKFVTHDGGVWVLRDEHPDLDVFGRIWVGDNVFIGLDTLIMPGVTIGDNVVIGARSVVTRDIPSDSVAVGSPAKVVASLDDYRRRLLDKGVRTKGFDPEAKREYLERHFADLDGDRG